MTGAIPRWACALDGALCVAERHVSNAIRVILAGVVTVVALAPPLLFGALLLANAAALVPALPAAVPALAVVAPLATGDPFLDLLVLVFVGLVVGLETLVALEWRFGSDWRERCQAARLRGS